MLHSLAGRAESPMQARILELLRDDGPISAEWEDAGMDRLRGAPEALGLRANAFGAPEEAFDAARRRSRVRSLFSCAWRADLLHSRRDRP